MKISAVDAIAAAIAVLVLMLTILISDMARAQTSDSQVLDHAAMSSGRSQGNVARFSTRIWRASEVVAISAAGTDGATTHIYLSNGGVCSESFPGLRGHPSDAQIFGYGALAYGVGFTIEEWIHRKHRGSQDAHVAMTFVNGGLAFAHTFAAIHNTRCF
jgi:hypothetical protein